MLVSDVLSLISDKKAAAGQVFDDISTAVSSIEINPDAATLQAQITDLQSKLDTANAALTADDAALVAEKGVEAALQTKIDTAKAALA